MTESLKFLTYTLEHQFPHPIAAPYRHAQTSQRSPDRSAYLVATVDGFLRYVGSALLSDFFSKSPAGEKSAAVLEVLRYPTMVKWAELILDLAGQLNGHNPFMPELVAAVTQKSGKPSATGSAMRELAGYCEGLLDSKEILVDEARAGEVAVKLEEDVSSFLGKFLFLEKYPLAVFRSHVSEGEGGFCGFMLRWMGYRLQPLPISVEFDGVVPLEVPLLVSPDTARAIEVSPFVALEAGANRQNEALYLVSGLRGENGLRLENIGTGRFVVRELKVKGEPASLLDYMESWASGGVAVLSPGGASARRLRFKSKLLPSEKVLEGRYKPLGFIGRGGIGAVYRVFDLEDQCDKAVKILYPDLSRNEFFTRYFLETGRLLSRLEHENLVPVYAADYSSTLQENHIIMAHMDGGSLAERIELRESLAPKEALRVAAGVLEAVQHLHANELVHGGIHPGNILFDDKGTPCLADFGILQLPSAKSTAFRPLERLHSMRYSSPELLLGGQATAASDIYSVGLVLFEMLTGRVPSKTEFVAPSELIFPIPEGLDEILEKALAYQAGSRFSTALLFSSALREIVDSLGPEFEVSPMAQAQQLAGHLSDVHSGHLESLDRERLELMESGDFEGAARLLQLRIDELWDLDEKVFWMQQLAVLYHEKLDKPGKAVSIYRDCLELAPDNPVAVDAIVGHFEKTEQWQELSQLLEELLEQTEDESQRADHLARLVDVRHVKLGDAAGAAGWLEQLVAQTGAEERWIELLVQLKDELQDHEGAARALETWRDRTDTLEHKVSILRRLAGLYHTVLEDFDAATKAYEELLVLEPAEREAMDGLRSLYRLSFAYGSLSTLLRRMIDSGLYETEDVKEFYQELGEILSSYLYETGQALKVWNDLLRLDPENHTALSYLERLYLREGRTDRYLEILETKAAVTMRPEEKASILLTAALAKLEFQSDVDGARMLLEEGLELAPGHRGIEVALERLYAEHADLDSQSRLLLTQLEREENAASRLEILDKLKSLFEKSDDPGAAMQVVKRAFSEDPTNPAFRQELERLGEILGDFEDLIEFYMERLPGLENEPGRYVCSRVAHHCTRNIKDEDKALYALEKASELREDSHHVQRALLSIYREQEKWGPLARQMLNFMKAADETRQAELFEEVALLVKNRLAGSEAGRTALEGLLEFVPVLHEVSLLASLKEACRALEAWDKLKELSHKQLEAEADPAAAQVLRMELGSACVQLGEMKEARKWFEKALDKAPADETVQKALEDTLVAAEDWSGLVRLYKRLVPVTEGVESRAAYMEKAAQIEMDVFENLESAIELYRQLTVLLPDRAEFGFALAGALNKAERFTELTWLYEQMARKLEGDEKKRLMLEMADVYHDKLDNPDAAIQTLRQVLKMDPSMTDAFEKARAICKEQKRFETELRLLGERSRQVVGSDSLHLKVEMARLSAFDMGLLPPAKTYLTEVLDIEPGHEEAFVLFRELLERQEDWKGLAELLARQFEAVTDETRKGELGVGLAHLYVDHLDHKVKATDILERVWETSPDNTRAALLLANVYSQMNRWDKTASMLSVLHELTESLADEEKKELIYLSALTYESLLQRPAAILAYRKSIDMDHRVDEAREKLAILLYMEEEYEESRKLIDALVEVGDLAAERMHELHGMRADIERKLGRREKSREHLDALLAQSPGNMEVLVKLLELSREERDREQEFNGLKRILDVETDPLKRFPLLVNLGDLARELGGREDEAATAYEKASELNPDSMGVLINLAGLYMNLERWEEAAKCFQRAETMEADPGRRAALAMSQGLIYAEHVGDAAVAATHLRRCLDLDPSKWDAFSILEKQAVDKADWVGQRELYGFMLDKHAGGDAVELQYKLHLNLGKILLEKFGNSAEALEHLERAAELQPGETEAQQASAGIYLQSSDSLDRALERYTELVGQSPMDANLLHMLRKTYSKMKRFDEAWFVTGVLEFLGGASQKEKAFYRKFSSSALKIKPRVLDMDQLRADLMAFEEDWELSEIIRILFERMSGKLQLQTTKSLGLSKKTVFDESRSPLYATLVKTVSQILAIQHPVTHIRETSGWIQKESCYPPVLVMSSDLLEHKKGKDLRFELARTLMLFVPHHQPVGLLDKDNLRLLLGNVLKLIVSSFPEPPGDPKANADLRKEMEKRIPAAELGKIRELVGQLRHKGGELSVKRWLVGVEKTALRFGLVFANDLEVAARLTRSCPLHLSVASREELVEDLVRYTVSDSFTRLRRHLSISVL